MISDDKFRVLLDNALKAQNIKKKLRDALVSTALLGNENTRNKILDMEEEKARLATSGKCLNTEAQEQKAFVAWFKATYPEKKIMSIRNDGYRTPREKSTQMLMGLLPGAADLYVPDVHTWIEMKRSDGGAGQSQVQKDFEKYVVNVCGDTYFLCKGAEEAKKAIKIKLDFY